MRRRRAPAQLNNLRQSQRKSIEVLNLMRRQDTRYERQRLHTFYNEAKSTNLPLLVEVGLTLHCHIVRLESLLFFPLQPPIRRKL